MTLFREINSLLFGLFLLVMSSLVYFQFTQTRDFMNQQMASDLNNTVTSLGLMLKPHLETGDLVMAETLVNVIFESGFYRKVTVKWLADGNEQIWENPITVQGVPQWFIDLGLFEPQKKEQLITSGWMQLATLEVEGHPALGYQELWRVMDNTLLILSLLFIVSVFFLRFRLNRILQPLHDIASHAKQIPHRNFGSEIALPRTRELRDVVGAINTMSGQLKQIFSTLDHEVSELKEEKFIDKVSGLPNRQYLNSQIHSWLEEPAFGGLILGRFEWLEEIYAKYGYQVRDETLKLLADKMQTELPQITDCVIARISHVEFAFLLTKAEQAVMQEYLQTLIRLINQELVKTGGNANTGFSLGVCQRKPTMNAYELLSQTDNALQQALNDQSVSCWLDAEQAQKYSREQWREKLTDAITHNQFVFQWQPILSAADQETIHREIYCRLVIDDQVISAYEFMPFIELLGLGVELDKCLLTAIKEHELLATKDVRIAVNLTHESLQDDAFTQWIAEFLSESVYVDKMLFEVSESAVINDLQASAELFEAIREAGARVGIDKCGRHIVSMDYLQKLRPDYIKLDQSYAGFDNSSQSKEICKAMLNVANGLSIPVILTGIETSEQLSQFDYLNVFGYQGYICPAKDVE